MEAWTRALARRGLRTAQVLLTHEDIASRSRYLAARDTFEALLEAGVVPVVNENDTVATAEIRMGDNDHLAALVALMLHADHLFLLTDTDGLFTADPHRDPEARRIPVLELGDSEEPFRVGGSHRGSPGSGGMASKVRAARRAAAAL
jgi:glutamate 5-kinase